MTKEEKTKLEEKIGDWRNKGKKENEITWGMLCDGYRSLSGIPDNFCSAEDPADRVKLWNDYQRKTETYRREQCIRNGTCWRCGRSSCGCD